MERAELAKLILEKASEYFDNLSYRIDVSDGKTWVDKVTLTISCEGYHVQQDFIVEQLSSFAGDKNEYVECAFEKMIVTLAKGVFRKRD